MELNAFRHLAGSIKLMSAVMGASVVVVMGVISLGSGSGEASISVALSDGSANVTATTAPKGLATPFASPTHIATPCPKRATLPC